jgi:hypothetical protein
LGDGQGRASKEAQLQVAGQRTVAERAIDTVLAKIGKGDERTAAEIELAVASRGRDGSGNAWADQQGRGQRLGVSNGSAVHWLCRGNGLTFLSGVPYF